MPRKMTEIAIPVNPWTAASAARDGVCTQAMAKRSVEPSRRDRLIAIALELFTRDGVRRTSVDDVAAAARIGKGSVYLEFRGKDELFRAAAGQLVDRIVADAIDAGARPGTLDDRVTEILAAKFWRLYELVHSRAHARELIEAKDAVAADLFRAADDRFAAQLVATLAAAARRGEWRPAAPHTPAEVAGVLLRAAHGTGYGAQRLTSTAFRDRLRLAVGWILAGARRR
jgi:TetR/AcrR family transcriptional regulator